MTTAVAPGQALLLARSEGQRVEITTDETDTSETWANPDGTLTTTTDAAPVRVQQADGSFDPVDLTLTRNSDGSYSPATTAAPTTISGGGNTTSATLSEGSGQSVGFGWSSKLPTPTVSGNVATYALSSTEDLVVTSTSEGFDEHVVLTAPPASALTLTLPLQLSDLTASQASSGAVSLVSTSGSTVARAQQFDMWDASAGGSPLPNQETPVSAQLEKSSAGTPELVLTPSMSYLTSPSTQYPVTIDPSANLTATNTNFWYTHNTSPENADYRLFVGTSNSGTTVYRSYVKFPLISVVGDEIESAKLNLWQYAAGSCSPEQIDGLATTANDSTAVWGSGSPPATVTTDEATASFNAGSGCSGGPAEESMTMTSMVQAIANGTLAWNGVELKADNESSNAYGKQFCSLNYGTSPCLTSSVVPYLSVTYSQPNTPQELGVERLHMDGSAGYTSTATPALSVYVSDPNSGVTEQGAFTLLNETTGGTVVVNKALGSTVNSKGISKYYVPSGDLVSGDTYLVEVWGYNGVYSASDQTATFTVDTTTPTTPTVSSSTFGSGSWTSATSGTFSFTSVADPDPVVDWYYRFNGGAVTAVSASSPYTTSTLTPPAGWDTLTVWAMDEAGNISSAATYSFGAGNAGISSPTANQVVTANPNATPNSQVPLAASGPYGAAGLTFQYQLNQTAGTWSNIPYGDVTDNGTALTGWPITPQQDGGQYSTAPSGLVWNLGNTLATLVLGGAAISDSQPIYVRAVFNPSSSPVDSVAQLMTANTTNVGDGTATDNAGPCTVDLWSGTCEVDASDAEASTQGGGALGLSRSFLSDDVPISGPFGPGWSAALPTDPTDVTTLVDTGTLQTISGSDSTVNFVPAAGGGYQLAPDEASSAATLTAQGSGSSSEYTYDEPSDQGGTDTQQIVFSVVGSPSGAPSLTNPWTYQASTIEPLADIGESTAIIYNASGYPTDMYGPQPPGDSTACSTTWAVGCEELKLTYASGVVTAATLVTANSSGGRVNTDVACYSYNASGQLSEEWDPRTVSSTCGAPVLATQYGYDNSGRLNTVTPPGLATWTIVYNANGTVADVQRTHSSTYGGQTEQTSFVYNAPIGYTTGDTYPDLSAGTAAGWGQYDDAVTATAVFPPGTTPSNTDLRPATVYGMDASGNIVNTATFDGTTQGGWDVDTTQYDQYGNQISELNPLNRAGVLAANCEMAGLPSGCPIPILTDAVSTISKYTSDGSEQLDEFDPTSTFLTVAGVETTARPHNNFTYGTFDGYVQGQASTYPSNFATVDPADDIASETVGASMGSASAATNEADDRTTSYAYALSSTDHAGWDWGEPESTTVDMSSGSNITKQTVIDDTTGLVDQVRQPSASGNSTSPATTIYTYYGQGSNISACQNTAWYQALCTTSQAGNPTGESGMPTLPTTQVTNYDYLLRPTTSVESVSDGGTNYTKTDTTTYGDGGVSPQVANTSLTGGSGTSLPTQHDYFSSTTGLPTAISTSSATSCSSAGPICISYDDFGNIVSYVDSTGATTTTAVTINNEPATIKMYTPSGSLIQTASYTYASSNEYRDLPTQLTYAGGTGYSSVGTYTASYDANGVLSSETLPDGSTLYRQEDADGNIVYDDYENSTLGVFAGDNETFNAHGQVATWSRPEINAVGDFTYDAAGRLSQDQTIDSQSNCTTGAYTLDVDSNRTAAASYPPASGGACSTSTTPTATQSLTPDSADRIEATGSAANTTYDAFGRLTTVPADLVSGSGNETVGYYTNDLVNTLAQGGVVQTWTLDPTSRYLTSTQTGSSTATTNHYSDASDSPSWSSLTSAGGAVSTSVNDDDLTGALAATTSDTSASTSVTYQLTDPQGNVIATTPPNETAVNALLNDPFGINLWGDNRYQWLGGHQRDASSLGGIVLMGARGYVPELGRFLSVDPDPGGSANPYDYCGQDPVNNVDLGGTYPIPPTGPSAPPPPTTNYDWAKLVLRDGAWPLSTNNITVMTEWMKSEDCIPTTPTCTKPWWNRNNPLNNGLGSGGGSGLGSYPNLVVAARYAAAELKKGKSYAAIVKDLARSAPPAVTAKAIEDSSWASSHYGYGNAWDTAKVPTIAAPASAWGR